jgi:hypothetical protein
VLIGAEEREHFHVPGIWGVAVARFGCQLRTSSHDLSEWGVLQIRQPGTPLGVWLKQIPQAAATCLIFEILDDLRVMVRVTGLAHLDLIDRLRRINMRLHEVLQRRPITLGAWRGLEQRRVLIGNDNSSTMFRRGQKRLRPPDSIRMPARPRCRSPPHGGIPFSEEETHSRPRFGGGGGFLSPVVGVWSPIRLTGAPAQNTLMPADALRLNAIHDA